MNRSSRKEWTEWDIKTRATQANQRHERIDSSQARMAPTSSSCSTKLPSFALSFSRSRILADTACTSRRCFSSLGKGRAEKNYKKKSAALFRKKRTTTCRRAVLGSILLFLCATPKQTSHRYLYLSSHCYSAPRTKKKGGRFTCLIRFRSL